MSEVRLAGRRSAADAEITRKQILAAALSLFSSKGYDATGVREIAAQAGVSHGVVRHHFGAKFDIWKSVIDDAFARYRELMLPVVEAARVSDKPLEAFRSVVSAFVQTSINTPEFAALFVREISQTSERADYCRENFSTIHEVIGGLFERARQESDALRLHSNDSFFYTLMSLTHFRLLHPDAAVALEFPLPSGVASMHDLIMLTLFRD